MVKEVEMLVESILFSILLPSFEAVLVLVVSVRIGMKISRFLYNKVIV